MRRAAARQGYMTGRLLALLRPLMVVVVMRVAAAVASQAVVPHVCCIRWRRLRVPRGGTWRMRELQGVVAAHNTAVAVLAPMAAAAAPMPTTTCATYTTVATTFAILAS